MKEPGTTPGTTGGIVGQSPSGKDGRLRFHQVADVTTSSTGKQDLGSGQHWQQAQGRRAQLGGELSVGDFDQNERGKQEVVEFLGDVGVLLVEDKLGEPLRHLIKIVGRARRSYRMRLPGQLTTFTTH